MILRLFLVLILLSGYCNASGDIQESYRLKDFSASSTWLTQGSAVMNSELKLARLTHDKPGQKGSIWNSDAFQERAWDLTLEYRIHGSAHKLAGDGIAIWYTADPLIQGSVFGSKDNWNGLAIFVDTYGNHPKQHSHPFITAMINTGSVSYDHDSDGEKQTLKGGCHIELRNQEVSSKIRLIYGPDENFYLLAELERKWIICMEAKIELSPGKFFGVSASTGDLHDNHDILDIQLRSYHDSVRKDIDEARVASEHEELDDYYRHNEEDAYEDEYNGNEHVQTTNSSYILGYLGVLIFLIVLIFVAQRFVSNRSKQSKYNF